MFEVSRVPVRDALQLLIGMGLAVNVPRRGVIVRPLSWQLLDELFEVRKILEGSAIRMAMRNATREHHRRLDSVIVRQAECLKTGDARQNAVLDDEFHRLLYDSVGNARLVELIFANWEMIKQARCASTVTPEHGQAWIGTSIKRHRRLLAAIKRGDEVAACAAIFENIESSQRGDYRLFTRNGVDREEPGSGVGPRSAKDALGEGRQVAGSQGCVMEKRGGVLVLIGLLCLVAGVAEAGTTLRLGHTDPPDGCDTNRRRCFADKVEKYTQGRYGVDVTTAARWAT
jgi:DNA-binding GntR family transcriptional regulator